MRHRKKLRNFNMDSSQRKALFRSMVCALIKHEIIQTTLPKAKELRRYAEPILTAAKVDNLAQRRYVYDRLRDREVVTKLFTTIAPLIQNRPGGYLRVLKNGYRKGDNAPMAVVELVDRVIVEEAAA